MRRGLLSCLLLVWLAGCAISSAPSPTPVTTPAAITSNGLNITLVLWHGWPPGPQSQALTSLVDSFNRQHPDGRVFLRSAPLATFADELREAWAVGGGPHIVLIPNSWIGSLAESGVLLPLDDQIPADEQAPLLPVALGGAQARDQSGAQRLYGLPISFDTLALYYNSANVQQSPADTAELIDIAHGLGAPDASPPTWGLALNLSLDTTIGYLYAFDGQVFDEQGSPALAGAGRAGAERWLNWLIQLKDDPRLLVQADSSIQVDRDLKNNRVLMTFDWAHKIAIYRTLWGKDLGVAPLPRLAETSALPRPYVASAALSINSRVGVAERRAAIEFLRFMISADVQRELLNYDLQPARRDFPLDGDDQRYVAARAFRTQAEQGQPMPNSSTREVVWQELKIMQQKALMGQATPADAVTQTDAHLRERLRLSP